MSSNSSVGAMKELQRRGGEVRAVEERPNNRPDFTVAVAFDPNDRRYRCCCGRSHATTGVRIIAGGLCVTVLLEFWQLCWHFLSFTGSSHSLPTPITGSVVQFLFGAFIVSSVLFALWRESSNLLLPYLLLQGIGLASVFVIFLALFYVVLDNDVETIKTFVNSHGPMKAETTDNADLVHMGWTLCFFCLCLLAIQFWLISIVFACWRYFRDKQIHLRGNNEHYLEADDLCGRNAEMSRFYWCALSPYH